MAKVGLTARVEAPPEELFDLLANPEYEPQWNPDVIEVERLDSGEIGPGSRWRGRYRGMGDMEIVLREYERPLRLAFDVGGTRVDMEVRFALAPAGSATDLATEGDVRAKGAMRLLAPLIGPMMRRTFASRPAQLADGVAKRRGARA